MLYRYMFLSAYGYVVYRHFDDLKCGVEKMAVTHRSAIFVFETEAADYCAYRNEMIDKYRTDDVSAIKRPNV